MEKIKVSEIRAKFPMYEDMPDEALIGAIRRKFYADIPMNQFVQKIDFDTEKEKLNPVKDNSFWENARIGVGKGLTDVARGIGQLTGQVSNEDVKESRKYDAPLMQTGGGMVGSVVGQAAPAILVPGAQTVLGAGATGSLLGLLSPAESTNERLANTAFGGVGGAATAGAVKAVGGATKAVHKALSPYLPGGTARIEGKAFRAIAGDKADDVVRALENSRQIVPGSLPNAGEASVGAQSPQFAALQEILGRGFATDRYNARDKAQQAARQGLLSKIAGDEDALKTALQIRDDVTAPMRERALSGANRSGLLKAQPFQDGLTELASRPENLTSSTVQSALGDVKKLIADATRPDGTIDANSLYTLRKSGISDTINKFAEANKTSDKRFTAGLLGDVKSVMDDAIEMAGGKGWKNYLQTYSRLSERPDQMKIGQFLQDKLTGAKMEERPAVFLNAMRTEPTTINKSINFKGEKISDFMRPDQMQSLNSITDDLLRQEEMARLARGGMKETQSQLQKLFEPVDIPGYLDAKVTATRWLLGKLQGGGGTKEMRQMAIDMLDPQSVAELMKAAAPKDRPAIQALLNALQREVYASGGGGLSGALSPAFKE